MNEAAYREILRRLGVEPPQPAPDPAAVGRLLGMPLDQFAREGCPVEIKTPWLDLPLWLVPSEAAAEALVREGVSRGRVWTAGELLDLLAVPGLTREQARTVALVKATFTGEVVEVRAVSRPEGSR